MNFQTIVSGVRDELLMARIAGQNPSERTRPVRQPIWRELPALPSEREFKHDRADEELERWDGLS